MRIVFMGTPEFAAPVLTEILAQGHDVAAVYTRAPRPAGRGLEARLSAVHRLADANGLPVETPKSLRGDEAAARLHQYAPEIVVVVAYGLILPPSILSVPPAGCLNLHGSLLPRWRGAAPIQRAVMAGDRETGVMVMRMDEGLDTGPVALAERVPIGPDDTAGDLHDRLARIGADLMARALAAAARDSLVFRPQPDEGVTYAHKIEKAEAAIDWTRPAADVHNTIRGLSPFPGAFLEADFGRGPERLKVLRSALLDGAGAPGTVLSGDDLAIACGSGAVRLVQVQRAGRPPMDAAAFRRGTRLEPGTSLMRAL